MRPYRKEYIFNQWIGKGCYHGFQIFIATIALSGSRKQSRKETNLCKTLM